MSKQNKIICAVVTIIIIFIILFVISKWHLRDKQSDHKKSESRSRPDRKSADSNNHKHKTHTENQGRIEVKASNPDNRYKNVTPDGIMVNTPSNIPQAPILRCYDYFEFPEGNFHVKTCGANTVKDPTPNPTRLFVQWFPVDGADRYNIYCSNGADVSNSSYTKSWNIDGSRYYFETEPLTGPECWSIVVSAVNASGVEGPTSKLFTTCA